MDIKLKNTKKTNYITYIITAILIAIALLAFKELKDNRRVLFSKNMYLNSSLGNEIDEFIDKVIDYSTYYKDLNYVKDKENITDNDREVCRQEIDYKIQEEYNVFYNNQYQKQTFHEKSAEERDKILEDGRKEIEEKYNFTEEEFEDYIIERKIKSHNELEGKLSSYTNLKYAVLDTKTNSWSGDKSHNTLTTKSESRFYLEISNNLNCFINGKEINKSDLIESNYLFNNIGSSNLKVYVWVPKDIQYGDSIYTGIKDWERNSNRILIVGIIFIVFTTLSIVAFKFIKNSLKEDNILNNIVVKARKYPIEYKIGVALITLFTWEMIHFRGYSYSGYIEYLNFTNVITLIAVLIIIYLIGRVLYLDYKEDTLFKNNVTTKVIKILQESFKKGSLLKTIIIYVFAYGVFGFGLLGITAISYGDLFPITFTIGILGTIILFVMVVKNLYYLDKIMLGAKDAAAGRLTYKIEEKGNGKLKELANNINNIKEGLRESIQKEVKSEKMKTELITNVSHDLKTPLTSIINYIDLLKREEIGPEEARDYVNILDKKSQRLKHLIEDLFEASKAASGAMELNIERLEITQLLKQALGENDEKLKEANLELKTNIIEDKIYINGDGKRLYRVFENLINNISKYSLNNTRVYVDVVKKDTAVEIIMKNISSYELNFDVSEITERFKRGDEARTSEGSGLGLAIAKSIVELHKGEFNIQIDGDLFKAIITLNIVK